MESSKNAKHNNFESILAKVGVDLAKNEHRRDLEKGDHCTVADGSCTPPRVLNTLAQAQPQPRRRHIIGEIELNVNI